MEMKPAIRNAWETDFEAIHEFVRRCPPLEVYPIHLYRIILRHFGCLCLIAKHNEAIVGCVMGLSSQQSPGTYFLWQIGVAPDHQRQGIGHSLLAYVDQTACNNGCNRIEATIDPENAASEQLFHMCGFSNISSVQNDTTSVQGRDAIEDFYGSGRHFMLYEKTLDSAKTGLPSTGKGDTTA